MFRPFLRRHIYKWRRTNGCKSPDAWGFGRTPPSFPESQLWKPWVATFKRTCLFYVLPSFLIIIIRWPEKEAGLSRVQSNPPIHRISIHLFKLFSKLLNTELNWRVKCDNKRVINSQFTYYLCPNEGTVQTLSSMPVWWSCLSLSNILLLHSFKKSKSLHSTSL